MVISIKIGVIEMPPLATACALDEVCAERGLAVDTARLVCKNLEYNCTFEWYRSSEYGDVDDNGTATGMVGAVVDGQFDTSLPVFTPTSRRDRAISFSDTYFYFDTVLATRAPIQNSEMDWSVVNGFNWHVWCVYLIQLTLCTLLLTFFLQNLALFAKKGTEAEPKQNLALFVKKGTDVEAKRNSTFWSSYFEIGISLVMNDFTPSLVRSFPLRLCYGAWLLAGIVLTSSYTGMLFSQKVVQSTNLPFTNLESFVTCLEKGRCRIITHTQSISFFQQLTVPGSDLSNRVGKALFSHPVVIVPLEMIPEAILNEKQLYLVWQWPLDWVYYSTKANQNCQYYIVDTPFVEVDTFPVRKNSSILASLNKMASTFSENAFDYAIRRNYFRPEACTYEESNRESNGLHSVCVIFYFYILGTSMAVFAASIELVLGRLQKS